MEYITTGKQDSDMKMCYVEQQNLLLVPTTNIHIVDTTKNHDLDGARKDKYSEDLMDAAASETGGVKRDKEELIFDHQSDVKKLYTQKGVVQIDGHARTDNKSPSDHDMADNSNSTTQNNKFKSTECPSWTMNNQRTKQCSVLCRFKLNDKNRSKMPKLNDMVEVIGPLDAMEAVDVFSELQQTQPMEEDAIFFEDESVMQIPPPSKVPRLNVQEYRVVNLDALELEQNSQKSLHDDLKFETTNGPNEEDDDRTVCIQAFAQYLFSENTIAAEAFLMAMLSTAERNPTTHEAIRTHDGSSLGCASLNFVLQHSSDCTSLLTRLQRACDEISPWVIHQALDITPSNLVINDDNKDALISIPEKGSATDKLSASSLQLPRGSTLLLNEAESVLLLPHTSLLHKNDAARRTIAALQSIASKQTIAYRFGPYCECSFDADYRTIVLSTSNCSNNNSNNQQQQQQGSGGALISCTLAMRLTSNFGSTRDDDGILIFPEEVASRMRFYLAKCRAMPRAITIPKAVCDCVEMHFVRQRALACTNNDKDDLSERNVHRWLTLCRLQARSRNVGVASVEDWEMASQLDDAMQASFMNNSGTSTQ